VDIGSSYTIKSVLPRYFISDLKLYLDLDDIFNFNQDFFLKPRIGAEISVLSFIRLRGGFYEGYPTAGFGLVFPVITINFAFYTQELGELPGTIPETILKLEIDITI
jgi:hypothetical protein